MQSQTICFWIIIIIIITIIIIIIIIIIMIELTWVDSQFICRVLSFLMAFWPWN